MLKIITHYLVKIKQNPFVKQSLITLVLRIFGVLLLFGFTLFLTKNFSAKIVGQYDFVRTYLFVIGSICLLGFDQSILYFKGRLSGSNATNKLKNTYKKMVVLVFLMAVILFLLLLVIDKNWITNYFNDATVYSILLKSTAILFFYSLTVLNTETFRALDQLYVAEFFRNTVKYVPVMVGSFFLISTNNPTYLSEVFIYGFIVLAIVSSLLLIYFFRKLDGTYTKSSFSYQEISVKSYPIAISGMAMFLLMSFDVFFLKKYRDDATVAYYGIAVKIMTLLTMIILTVNITISAKISEFFAAKNSIELNAITKKSSRLIFLLTAPTALIMCLLAPYLLSVFGTNYEQAHDALLILIIGQTISSLFGSAGVYLNMTGRQSTFQWTLVIAVIINFVLNRLLIPDYGMIGAAIAFVMSTLFWNTLVSIIIYRVDKVKVYLN